jgi:hypothetical protein
LDRQRESEIAAPERSLETATPVRLSDRDVRRQFVLQLRQSPPPGTLKLALHGLWAGAASTTVVGLMYVIVFGVVFQLLGRWQAGLRLTGYSGLLLPLFVGSLVWSAAWSAILASIYHVVCRVFPRLAGVPGAIGFMVAASLVSALAVQSMWTSAPIQLSYAVRVFGFAGSLVSSAIVGAVVGYVELFDRKPLHVATVDLPDASYES